MLVFQAHGKDGRHNPIIIISAEYSIPADIRAQLDSLSVFGQSRSDYHNSYEVWEFSSDANYVKAHVLLRTSGWQTAR